MIFSGWAVPSNIPLLIGAQKTGEGEAARSTVISTFRPFFSFSTVSHPFS